MGVFSRCYQILSTLEVAFAGWLYRNRLPALPAIKLSPENKFCGNITYTRRTKDVQRHLTDASGPILSPIYDRDVLWRKVLVILRIYDTQNEGKVCDLACIDITWTDDADDYICVCDVRPYKVKSGLT